MASITLKDINDTLKSNHEESKEENRLAREGLANFLADMQKKMAEKSRKDQTAATNARLKDLENRRESVQSKGLIGNSLSGAGDAVAGVGAGLGDAFKGLGALGLGIGGFFLGLAGAEAIMSNFGTGDNLKKLIVNLGEAIQSLDTKGLIAVGALLTGSALFMQNRSFGSQFKVATGMTLIGAGIGGFFAGLSTADAAMSWMGVDGIALKDMLKNLGEGLAAFAPRDLAALGVLLTGSALFMQNKSFGSQFKVATGMTLIGAGIGGFFAGLTATTDLASFLGADGSGIKTMMINIADGLAAFASRDLGAIAAMLAVGGLFGAVPLVGLALTGGAALGMTAIGLGIGGFFSGLAGVGDVAAYFGADGSGIKTMMINIADGLAAFSGVDASSVFGATGAMALLSPALVAFFGAQGIATVIDSMTRFVTWVTGGTDPITTVVTQIKKFSELKDVPNLEGLGASLTSLSGGLLAFFGTEALGSFQGVTTEALASIASVFDSLFGTDIEGELRKGILTRLIEGLEPLKTLDSSIIQQMDTLGSAINGLVDSFTNLSNLEGDGPTNGLLSMLKGVAAILAVKDNLIEGGVYDGVGWSNARDIDFGQGLKNFTEDDMATISAGVSRLYAAMNVPTPMQGAELAAGGAGSQSGSTGGGTTSIRGGDTTTVGGAQITLNGVSDPLPSVDYRYRSSGGRAPAP